MKKPKSLSSKYPLRRRISLLDTVAIWFLFPLSLLPAGW